MGEKGGGEAAPGPPPLVDTAAPTLIYHTVVGEPPIVGLLGQLQLKEVLPAWGIFREYALKPLVIGLVDHKTFPANAGVALMAKSTPADTRARRRLRVVLPPPVIIVH